MQDDLYAMRHSLAHILATAVQNLWPKAKFGVGPVISDGFYYDLDLGADKNLSIDDLPLIEAEMRKVIKQDQSFKHTVMSIEAAMQWAKTNHQPYKLELLNDLARDGTTAAGKLDTSTLGLSPGSTAQSGNSDIKQVSFYTNGDFTDLCCGPHVASTTKVGSFKLTEVAGAYWRGLETNPQMIRVYGVAFPTQKQLNQYLEKLELNKSRDHRIIGKQQEIFMSSNLIGAGLPLWLEAGATIYREIERFITDEEIARGYKHVITPDISHIGLYEKSGHYPYYKESMYSPIDIDGEQFMLRPMNCPHHFQIYSRRPHSYRELPFRLAEFGQVYRYEKSGELSGLARTRCFTINDAHIICTPEQAGDEIKATLDFIDDMARCFGMEKGRHYSYRLALGDATNNSKYVEGSDAWRQAEDLIRQVFINRGDDFDEVSDEAAFYGPKIDVQQITASGHEETVSTVQYDFVMPKRFDLKYIDKNNQQCEAVVIHRALIGSMERFVSFLLEHFKGNLPVWLAPEQLRLIPINDSPKILKYVDQVHHQARELGIRTQLDKSSESIGKRIRQATLAKVPYTLVIGDNELQQSVATPRLRQDLQGKSATPPEKITAILATIAEQITTKQVMPVDSDARL